MFHRDSKAAYDTYCAVRTAWDKLSNLQYDHVNPTVMQLTEYVLDRGNERPLTKPSSCGGGPSAE